MNTKMIAIACVCLGFISGYALRSIFIPVKRYDTVLEKQRITAQNSLQQKAEQWDSARKTFRQQQIYIGKEVAATKQQLAREKGKQKAIEQRTRRLAENGRGYKDTSALLTNCDSLRTAVILLADNHHYTDSLYGELTSGLEQQALTKDSMVDEAEQYINELQLTSSRCLDQQQNLLKDNQQLRKQVRKEKRKYKLISTLVCIASGAAIYGLLQ